MVRRAAAQKTIGLSRYSIAFFVNYYIHTDIYICNDVVSLIKEKQGLILILYICIGHCIGLQMESVEICKRMDGSWWLLGTGACGTVSPLPLLPCFCILIAQYTIYNNIYPMYTRLTEEQQQYTYNF